MNDRSSHILVVTNLYPTEIRPARGAFVALQVESLRALGNTVEVLRIDGERSRWEYLRGASRVRRALSAAPYDLVHAHYGLTGIPARAQGKVPLILTHLGSDLLWSRQRPISRAAGLLADFNLVMSREMRNLLGVDHTAVLPNGTDLNRFHPVSPAMARTSLGWEQEEFIVLFPADPSRREKNYPLAAAAFEVFARSCPLPCRLVPVHGQAQERFNVALNAGDVCLMTSRWEGSSNAVREALAVGLPVVSVAAGDAAEMLGGIAHCAVRPPLAGKLAQALGEVARARRTLGRPVRHGGRERVERFSTERIARKLTVVYQAIRAGIRDGSEIQAMIDEPDRGRDDQDAPDWAAPARKRAAGLP